MSRTVVTLQVASLLLVLSAFAVGYYTQHAAHDFEVLVAQREEPEDNAVLRHRVGELEKTSEAIRDDHRWLTGLLIGNLVAVLASLATYLVMHRGPGRQG